MLGWPCSDWPRPFPSRPNRKTRCLRSRVCRQRRRAARGRPAGHLPRRRSHPRRPAATLQGRYSENPGACPGRWRLPPWCRWRWSTCGGLFFSRIAGSAMTQPLRRGMFSLVGRGPASVRAGHARAVAGQGSDCWLPGSDSRFNTRYRLRLVQQGSALRTSLRVLLKLAAYFQMLVQYSGWLSRELHSQSGAWMPHKTLKSAGKV